MRWLFACIFKDLLSAIFPPYFRLNIRARLRRTGEQPKRRTTKLTLGGVIMLKLTRIGVVVLISFLFLVSAIPLAQQAQAQSTKKSAAWVKVPGAANGISISADGTVWMVSTERGRGGFMIYRRVANKTWQKMNVTATRIAAGPKGTAKRIDSDFRLHRYDSKNWYPEYKIVHDISFGADGSIWRLGNDHQSGGGFDILYIAPGQRGGKGVKGIRTTSGGRLKYIGAQKIAAGSKESAWMLTHNRDIYAHTANSRWRKIQHPSSRVRAKEIAIGANGAAWIVGSDNMPWHWSGKKWTRHVVKGGAAQIAVGPKGYPWVVQASKAIYALTPPPPKKKKVVVLPIPKVKERGLGLARGWAQGGGGYSPAQVSITTGKDKAGYLVTVSGRVMHSVKNKASIIATLPDGFRPAKRLIFKTNAHEDTVRIDVLTDGRVALISTNRKHDWLSLDGIVFTVGAYKPLRAAQGRAIGSPGWGGDVQVFKSGNRIVLKGEALRRNQVDKFDVAILPKGMRPTNRLIFNVVRPGSKSRVDILPNGKICWDFRGSVNRLNLTGVSFVLGGSSYQPWKPVTSTTECTFENQKVPLKP